MFIFAPKVIHRKLMAPSFLLMTPLASKFAVVSAFLVLSERGQQVYYFSGVW